MQVRQVAKAGLIRQYLVRNGWSVLTVTTHAARPGWLVVSTQHRRLVVNRSPVKVEGVVLVHAPHRWAIPDQYSYGVQRLDVSPVAGDGSGASGHHAGAVGVQVEAVREAVVEMCRAVMTSPAREDVGVAVVADEEVVLLATIRERLEDDADALELARATAEPVESAHGERPAARGAVGVSSSVAALYSQLFALHELT